MKDGLAAGVASTLGAGFAGDVVTLPNENAGLATGVVSVVSAAGGTNETLFSGRVNLNAGAVVDIASAAAGVLLSLLSSSIDIAVSNAGDGAATVAAAGAGELAAGAPKVNDGIAGVFFSSDFLEESAATLVEGFGFGGKPKENPPVELPNDGLVTEVAPKLMGFAGEDFFSVLPGDELSSRLGTDSFSAFLLGDTPELNAGVAGLSSEVGA